MAGISPISEALGVAASRLRLRLCPPAASGSVGFLLGQPDRRRLIARTGPMIALWWIVGCLIVTGLLAVNHPGGRKVPGQIPPRMGEIGQLVLNPTFAIFVAALSFTRAGHAVFYAYGTLYWASLRLSEARIGALWAAGSAPRSCSW